METIGRAIEAPQTQNASKVAVAKLGAAIVKVNLGDSRATLAVVQHCFLVVKEPQVHATVHSARDI